MLEFLMFLAPWGQGLCESQGLLQQVLLWRTWSRLPSGGNLLRPDLALLRAWALFSPEAVMKWRKHVLVRHLHLQKASETRAEVQGVKSLVHCSFLFE